MDLVARRLQLLGQPLRIRLIDALDRLGEMSVQALADEIVTTQQNASNHLGMLARAGLLGRRQEGRQARYVLASPARRGFSRS